MRAINSMYRRDHSSAIGDLSKFIELKPSQSLLVAAYSHRAQCHLKLGKPEHGARDLTDALSVQPRNPTLLRERACAWFEADRYAEAIKDADQASDASSEGEELLDILKVHLYFAAGNEEEGRAILQRLEPKADGVGAQLNIAEAYLVVSPSEALRTLQRIKSPKDDIGPLIALKNIALILQGKRTAAESIEEMRQLKDENKRTTWSWFEIRQFLRWGMARNVINEKQKQHIEQLIGELGSEVGSLAWSAVAQARWRTPDRLRLSPHELVPAATGRWLSDE